jgi:hypothetical protein
MAPSIRRSDGFVGVLIFDGSAVDGSNLGVPQNDDPVGGGGEDVGELLESLVGDVGPDLEDAPAYWCANPRPP